MPQYRVLAEYLLRQAMIMKLDKNTGVEPLPLVKKDFLFHTITIGSLFKRFSYSRQISEISLSSSKACRNCDIARVSDFQVDLILEFRRRIIGRFDLSDS